MAIMYDHQIEATVTVYVRSTMPDGLDNDDDMIEAVKADINFLRYCGNRGTDRNFFDDYEIINTTAGDY
jgi:hypothetical protein